MLEGEFANIVWVKEILKEVLLIWDLAILLITFFTGPTICLATTHHISFALNRLLVTYKFGFKIKKSNISVMVNIIRQASYTTKWA